eukprot:12903825-Prorocentrum_lima.AAC.1
MRVRCCFATLGAHLAARGGIRSSLPVFAVGGMPCVPSTNACILRIRSAFAVGGLRTRAPSGAQMRKHKVETEN